MSINNTTLVEWNKQVATVVADFIMKKRYYVNEIASLEKRRLELIAKLEVEREETLSLLEQMYDKQPL
jgi:hypothetical protein